MIVEAIKISDSKERIEIDGKEFLKSVNIGRWNYVVRISYYNPYNDIECSHVGKTANLKNAEAWVPRPMFQEIHPDRVDEIKELKAKGYGSFGKVKYSGMYHQAYKVPFENIKREIVKIER